MQFGRKIFFSFLFLSALFFIRCNKEEPIPSYIHVDKFTLTTNYTLEGSASHKILDAWVYIDDNLVGAFEMPCTVPVLYEGSHTIKIFPGIKENGIAETRIIYPFYNFYQTTASLTPGEITALAPITTYNNSAADFEWMEDFEAGHTICKADGLPDSIMAISSSAYEGSGSGMVNITGTSYFGQSCGQFTLPKTGTDIFLEFNYKCNTAFNVGILGYNGSNIDAQTIALTLNPSENWNKIYVNLTREVNEALTSTKFRIFFSMLKDQNLSSSEFRLDNIKLIH